MASTDKTTEDALGNSLKLSSNKIIIDPETLRSEIVVCNLHHQYTIYFKIKTRIQKLFDVKPYVGSIQPQQQLNITFRSINKIYQEQISNIQQNLLFLLQAVNHTNSALTSQQQQTLWKDIKSKRANIELGYYSLKLAVIFSPDKSQSMDYLPPLYNTPSSKTDNKYPSEIRKRIKSGTKNPKLTYSHFMHSDHKRQQRVYEQELQKKYEELNEKQRQLIQQKSKLIDQTPQPKQPQRASPIKIIVILLLTFIIGNLLCYLMLPLQIRAAYFEKWDWFHKWFI